MNAAELLIRKAPVIKLRGNIYIAGEQMGVAEAALAASAAGGNGDAVLFKNLHNGIAGLTGNGFCFILNCNGYADTFGHIRGIIGLRTGIMQFTEHFAADKFALNAQRCGFLFEELIHLLRAADKDGIIFVCRRIFFDKLCGDKALFGAGGHFIIRGIAEYVNDFDFAALLFKGFKLIPEKNTAGISAALKKHKIKILIPVFYCICH